MDKLFDNKFEFVLLFAKNYKYDYTFHKIRISQKYIEIDPQSEKYHPEGRCIGNVIRIPAYRPPNIKERNYHVAAFPEELVYVFLSAFTNPEDYVLDPFLGSGTTLKVCRIMNRRGIGYEIDAGFKDIIWRRVLEPWTPPPFEELDIINSTSVKLKSKSRRPKLKKNPYF
jgi:DNA modification methylase